MFTELHPRAFTPQNNPNISQEGGDHGTESVADVLLHASVARSQRAG